MTQVCSQFMVLHGARTCTWRNTHICVPKTEGIGIYIFQFSLECMKLINLFPHNSIAVVS